MDASVWAFQVLIITGLFSTARHRRFCSWPCWRSPLFSWITLHTSDPLGSHSWMSGPYAGLCGGGVRSVQPLYLRPTEAKPVVGLVSQQAITSPQKLGQLWAITVTRAQYLVQWKGIVAVSIVFLESGWECSTGNGTGPCRTKRIIKTKQLWQVWNLRTLPGRHEDYQSRAVCWRGWQLAVRCTLVTATNGTENTDIESLPPLKRQHLTERNCSKWQPSRCNEQSNPSLLSQRQFPSMRHHK